MPDRLAIHKLITGAARSALSPLGLKQKGRSRLWYDDRGWSLVLVEFQPGRAPGTYLNVGAMWLWTQRAHLAYDSGGRTYWRDEATFTSQPPLGEPGWQTHVDFLHSEQFRREMELAANVAAARVTQLRQRFRDVAAVAEHLTATPPRPGESHLWHAFHGGTAAALNGELATAEKAFTRVVSANSVMQWELDLAALATGYLKLLDQPSTLRSHLLDTVRASRQLLNLPTAALSNVGRQGA